MNSTERNQYISEQLSQLRDLLIVIERGGDTAPDVLYKIAIEKSQHITALVEAWRAEANPAPVEIPAEYAQWLDSDDDASTQENTNALIDTVDMTPMLESDVDASDETLLVVANDTDTEQGDDAEAAEEEEEYIAPFVEDFIPEEEPMADDTTHNVSNAFDDFVSDTEAEETDDEAHTLSEAEMFDDTDEDVYIETDEIAVVDYEVEVADTEEESQSMMLESIVIDEEQPENDIEESNATEEDLFDADDLYNRGEPMDNEFITLGDKMTARQAKELRKALSLNDRFRFRRELFGNSDVNMNDTLNLIDTMSDYNEVLEYLVQDLNWSTDELVVQEFLQLVERHFKQR